MKYVSTRNSKLTVPGSTAVLTGLAPDGGLYVPESFPYFSEEKIRAMEEMDYPERSATVMSAFFDEPVLRRAPRHRTPRLRHFRRRSRAPRQAGRRTVRPRALARQDARLQGHGALRPSSAHDRAQSQGGAERDLPHPVATSGDTGKAALEGFSGVEGTGVVVFYPGRRREPHAA